MLFFKNFHILYIMDENKLDLLILYKNYIHSILIREEYGDIYGDDDEIIELYEKELEKFNIKKLTK